jgi:hypothetical protein
MSAKLVEILFRIVIVIILVLGFYLVFTGDSESDPNDTKRYDSYRASP